MNSEEIIKKINPIVGSIFHSGKRLGGCNAPAEEDWEYLTQGTDQIVNLVRTEVAAALARQTAQHESER